MENTYARSLWLEACSKIKSFGKVALGLLMIRDKLKALLRLSRDRIKGKEGMSLVIWDLVS